ncbi:hypothetical protein NL676_025000 [Syzygium grande]|nr:hypothetical protein NL676_025000 [Syzygium grande]
MCWPKDYRPGDRWIRLIHGHRKNPATIVSDGKVVQAETASSVAQATLEQQKSTRERKIESANEVQPLYPLNAEFARPSWIFGLNSYEVIQRDKQADPRLLAATVQSGRSYLAIIDVLQSSLSLLDIPFTDIQGITSGNNCLYIEGASGLLPTSVAKVTLNDEKSESIDFQIIWSFSPDSLKYQSYFSLPELIEFPTEVHGRNAYAFFYPPSNQVYQASQEEMPLLLLESHGGPTWETRGVLNLSIQYWTSRGWAFMDVNYGGSTDVTKLLFKVMAENSESGYWVAGAESGKVDGTRLCITGGSAGGYTTLAALAFKETFKAGASLYGSEKDYYERSPINFVEKFSCSIILFQGLEGKVVLPGQACKIYAALKQKGLPVALVEYEGEQHGFARWINVPAVTNVRQESIDFLGHMLLQPRL